MQLKIELEEALKDYSNVLVLRVNLPLSSDSTAANLLTKLITYTKIVAVPTSVTVLDDLWPVEPSIKSALDFVLLPQRLPGIIEAGTVGKLNFTSPGAVSNGDVLSLYREIVKPGHTWTTVKDSGNRPFALLNTDRLFNVTNAKPATVAIEEVMHKIKEERG